ncbi:ATP-binding protein [Aurantimonas sp. C2-6-R+9]|uniref:ATP-binding protein n=1 Tax=unclassified Aurantimonas TaxID=2638230 RepID=UPI002E172319|nr:MULTISPECIES: ATP-binding protein [unclassified Aurantimonas]MEC5293322.1 ATP-binding protein [Aurantimonas sp. C2-3-R2]MEC5383286.1 ATP-binding protein [Aurantimonas sp. C2-6-R+9]MEC5414253.1 ATP-binding protein [Aurantimonas sp. C2-4-R8]
MKPIFVETDNVKRFQTALTAMERRGAEEACLMVVDGPPGLGKTSALYHWVAQTGTIYLRANAEWRPSWFLEDLLGAFRIRPQFSFQKRFQQSMEALLLRQQQHMMQQRTFAVVIDEADHISRKREIMETIRDFSDGGNIPFVLVGMGKIRDNLARYPQVSSRIAQYVRFEQASPADVKRFVDAICDAKVAPDLLTFIHRVSGGYNREIKEAIATIETFARRNGLGDDENPVTMADMAGQVLVNDRKSGIPVIVPEVA